VPAHLCGQCWVDASGLLNQVTKEVVMGMADPRSYTEKIEQFAKNKEILAGVVEELLAVEMLEYNNKNWLTGDNKTRCESKMETLRSLKNEIINLRR
jgi:hypothetical protein